MHNDVYNYVDLYYLCQEYKSQNLCPAGLLQLLPRPPKHWGNISMNIITYLPVIQIGYLLYIVFIDRLSKMAHFMAAPSNLDSKQLIQLFLCNVFYFHGIL